MTLLSLLEAAVHWTAKFNKNQFMTAFEKNTLFKNGTTRIIIAICNTRNPYTRTAAAHNNCPIICLCISLRKIMQEKDP
jgi:hypothetical protein